MSSTELHSVQIVGALVCDPSCGMDGWRQPASQYVPVMEVIHIKGWVGRGGRAGNGRGTTYTALSSTFHAESLRDGMDGDGA